MLGRREHLDVVARARQRLGQVAHVGLDAAGDVPLVRADQADPHQAGPPSARPRRRRVRGTSGQIRPSMCQSSGCSPIVAAKASATCLRRRVDPVAQPARPGDRHLGVDDAAASRAR